jgi:hypothetical protein
MVELAYVEGCPNVAAARENLRLALMAAGFPPTWTEWEQGDPRSPESARRFDSPTILVNGQDVTGERAGVVAAACRTDGAPSVAVIRSALAAAE